MADQIFSDVCVMYDWTHSIKETAEQLDISQGKVRKILITEGYDMGMRAKEVKELADQGLSADEIAEKLHRSLKSVNAYMPYSKGTYLPEKRSADALRSERYRKKRAMLDYSDRVLNPNGEYGFVTPSSRDIQVSGGFFHFNLSKLMALTEKKEPIRMKTELFTSFLAREEETYDEPPIVLEFNPTVIYAKDYKCPPETEDFWRFKLLNYNNQMMDLLEEGKEYAEVYLFQMEEYVPYITKHFREFARYWNSKLYDLIQDQKRASL